MESLHEQEDIGDTLRDIFTIEEPLVDGRHDTQQVVSIAQIMYRMANIMEEMNSKLGRISTLLSSGNANLSRRG